MHHWSCLSPQVQVNQPKDVFLDAGMFEHRLVSSGVQACPDVFGTLCTDHSPFKIGLYIVGTQE